MIWKFGRYWFGRLMGGTVTSPRVARFQGPSRESARLTGTAGTAMFSGRSREGVRL